MKKTGRKEGENKLNGNTLRTRAGNRGGSVLRRGKKLVRAREISEYGFERRDSKNSEKDKEKSLKSRSHLPQESRNLREPTNLGPCGVSRG